MGGACRKSRVGRLGASEPTTWPWTDGRVRSGHIRSDPARFGFDYLAMEEAQVEMVGLRAEWVLWGGGEAAATGEWASGRLRLG